jgi:hypothetical protein
MSREKYQIRRGLVENNSWGHNGKPTFTIWFWCGDATGYIWFNVTPYSPKIHTIKEAYDAIAYHYKHWFTICVKEGYDVAVVV